MVAAQIDQGGLLVDLYLDLVLVLVGEEAKVAA